MNSKFNLSAALAISGAAFFAGSLITLNMVSVAPQPGYSDAQVTRAATSTLTQVPQQQLTQPAPQQVAVATPAPASQVALPATDGLTQQDANALLAALTQSAQAPGAGGTGGVMKPAGGDAAAPNLNIMQAAAETFRARGGAQSLDEAIKRNAVSDLDRGRQTVEIHELLNNAARNGLIQVPAGLTSADGSVDTRTLLFDIVNRAVSENTTSTTRQRQVGVATAPTTAPATQPLAAAPQPAARPSFYTVEPGDSLAFIALQFYGSTTEFRRIFNANRDVLTNPDRISVGQRLRIPAS